jgi:Cyclin, N-terminal domain/Cyclin, C-terminal domain
MNIEARTGYRVGDCMDIEFQAFKMNSMGNSKHQDQNNHSQNGFFGRRDDQTKTRSFFESHKISAAPSFAFKPIRHDPKPSKLEIVKNFLASCEEESHLPDANYFVLHPQITNKDRRVVVEWLVGLTTMIKVRTDVSFAAVNLLDRFLSATKSWSTARDLHILALVSFFIACNNEGLHELTRCHLQKLCKERFTDDEIDDVIDAFNRSVNYGPRFTSALQYFDSFSNYLDLTREEKNFGWMLLETALLDYKMIAKKPSLQAVAALHVTQYYFGKKANIHNWLRPLLGYSEDHFHEVKDRMLEFYRRLSQLMTDNKVFEKFSSHSYCEVSKLRFPLSRSIGPSLR